MTPKNKKETKKVLELIVGGILTIFTLGIANRFLFSAAQKKYKNVIIPAKHRLSDAAFEKNDIKKLNQSLLSENNEMIDELSNINSEKEVFRSSKKPLEELNRKDATHIEELKGELNSLKEKKLELEKKLESSKNLKERESSILTDRENALKASEDELSKIPDIDELGKVKASEEIENRNKNYESQKQIVESAQGHVVKGEEELTEVENSIRNIEEKLKDTENHHNDRTKKINEYDITRSDNIKKIISNKTQIAKNNGKIYTAERDIESHKKKLKKISTSQPSFLSVFKNAKILAYKDKNKGKNENKDNGGSRSF